MMNNISQILSEYSATERARQENLRAATKAATAVFREYFPTDDGNLDAPEVLAACVGLFDLGDKKDAGQLYLEWLVERYVGKKVEANLNDVKLVVEALKDAGYTENNPYIFNDCDNRLFYIPFREKYIFCAESQNTRYIFILDGNKLHIRRYYDDYDFDAGEWDQVEDAEEYRKSGIKAAIANSSWLSEQWSDCLPGNQYPDRPNLKYFKNNNFNPRYGDCRDIGYVLSYSGFHRPQADRAIFNYTDIKMAFFELRGAVGEVETEFEGH